MPRAKLHDDEVDIGPALVAALVASQFPQWADSPLTEVRPSGTVNTIFRLGADLYVRLPRAAQFVASLATELQWLGALSEHLPLAVPEPVAAGTPAAGYPFLWAVYRW